MNKTYFFAALVGLGLSGAAFAQMSHSHTEGMDHNQNGDQSAMEGMETMSSDPMMKSTITTHSQGMDHSMMSDHSDAMPSEPGQGAFAAISEIVVMLSADPETDWSQVNIAALRAHLVDMDMLISHAQVATTEIEDGIEMQISLAGLGGGAVSRMVPAHGPVLRGETGWESEVIAGNDALTWRVSSAENVDKIRALGFFGLMALGDHHRAHHIGMARGIMVH